MSELSWDSARCKYFQILPSKYNLREANNVEELAESIKHYGLLQPIVIRPDHLVMK
jgi:ParB-like chromosome segregation protein Spo0J